MCKRLGEVNAPVLFQKRMLVVRQARTLAPLLRVAAQLLHQNQPVVVAILEATKRIFPSTTCAKTRTTMCLTATIVPPVLTEPSPPEPRRRARCARPAPTLTSSTPSAFPASSAKHRSVARAAAAAARVQGSSPTPMAPPLAR